MGNYDANFEIDRLDMIAKQFKEYVQYPIQIIFLRDSHNSIHYRWKFSKSVPKEQRGVTDFRLLMGDLIDDLIEYRSQFGIKPSNEGIISINSGKMEIEWVIDGGTELSK